MPNMTPNPLGRQPGIAYQQPHRPQMPMQPQVAQTPYQQYLQQPVAQPQQQYTSPGAQNAIATLIQSGLFNN